MAVTMNDARERKTKCRRWVRKDPHVWTDLPPQPYMCRYCGRRFGRRYKPPNGRTT